MEAQVRRVVVCGSCGGHITLYDLVCPYCGNLLEPVGDVKHVLPHATNNPYAIEDAIAIKPHLESIGKFYGMYPDQIDWLADVIRPLREHKYPYREYIIDLLSLVAHFRSVCLDKRKDTRETHLEIYKRLDAIYNSLTGNSAYS